MPTKLLNARQEAELNSSRATEQHIDENIAVINEIAAFLANFNGIKANNAAIIGATELKGASLTVASRKTNLRARLNKEILEFAGVVEGFADDTGDLQLRDDTKLIPTRIKRMRDDEIAPLCQFIHNRALPHAVALKDYNIKAADFTALQTLINDYSAESPKPRTTVTQRKTTNANIAALFADNRKRYKKLDKQMETLRETNPDFVNTYFSNREVFDTSSNSKKENGEKNKTKEEIIK